MLLKRSPRRKKVHSEGSWAVSYVDMLTLLLCFFIIFYNNSKGKNEETLLQKIAVNMNDKTGKATPSPTASVSMKDIEEGKVAALPEDLALLQLIKTNALKDISASIIAKDKSLEINFEGISFFRSGQTNLLPEAKNQITKMIEALDKHKGTIRITVQGHTDPTKSKKPKSHSDNWELSVLRATSVLKMFINSGYSQELLSAEGFADTRIDRSVASFSKEELARQRRITLRIEPVQVNQ
jgi:chemotaxis protein MotB